MCQTLLLATSHSGNLLVYCLSSPAFRKRLYMKLSCKQSSDSRKSNVQNIALHDVRRRHDENGENAPTLGYSLSDRITTKNLKTQFCPKILQDTTQHFHLNGENNEQRFAFLITRTTTLSTTLSTTTLPEMQLSHRNNSI